MEYDNKRHEIDELIEKNINKLKEERGADKFLNANNYFNRTYYRRLLLFAALVNTFPTLSWKSHKCLYDIAPAGRDWFIVGILTTKGQYTYYFLTGKEVAFAPKG